MRLKIHCPLRMTFVRSLLVILALLQPTVGQNLITTKDTTLNAPKINSARQKVPSKLIKFVPADYNIHEQPPLLADGKPVPIQFSISARNIPHVDELKQEIAMEMNLRIYWVDSRLEVDSYFAANTNSPYLNLSPSMISQLWVPDVYSDYTKSVKVEKILTIPASLRIYPNSTVRYSSRLLIELACPMDFHLYPADTQFCNMSLESYAYTRDQVSFSWRPEGSTVNFHHRLSHFDFSFMFFGEKSDVNFESGSYPAIKMMVRLHRRINYHMLQTYIPSMMLVVVSWLSFMVPIETPPVRTAICMTTLLTLTAMFAAVRQSTPSVSYIKALDVWMVVCIFGVFLTLLEYTIILRLQKNNKNPSPLPSPAPTHLSVLPHYFHVAAATISERVSDVERASRNDSPDSRSRTRGRPWSKLRTWWHHPSEKSIKRVERISSVAVPSLFVAFNLIYWPVLMAKASLARVEAVTSS